MKNINNLIKRLKNIMPSNVNPTFNTIEELLIWRKEQEKQYSEIINRENQEIKIKNIFDRSGIRPLHKKCSLDNYIIENNKQKLALQKIRQYINDFDKSISSFIFSGKPGTGKNHLAAAICNELLLRGNTVLIITVADIMSAMKETFIRHNTSEEKLINNLSSVALLVIDEIGVQIESRYEKVIINQIVDRRSSFKRPTGMLTNFKINDMIRLLGERVIDRMRLGGNSLWINFTWESYRDRLFNKKL